MIIPSQVTSDGYLLREDYGSKTLVIAVAGYLSRFVGFIGVVYPLSVSINSGRTFSAIGDGTTKVHIGSGKTFTEI
jgi:hypothetical protein